MLDQHTKVIEVKNIGQNHTLSMYKWDIKHMEKSTTRLGLPDFGLGMSRVGLLPV